MSSLRERRREMTTEAVHRAAVELADAHGLDNVTTEMISEAAGISPRTFFNYFPYKEAAFAPPSIPLDPHSVEVFLAGKGALLDDIADLVALVFERVGSDRDYLRKAHRISKSNPKLLALRIGAFHEFDNKVATLITKRLGLVPDDQRARHMAVLVSASSRLGFAIWVESGDGTARASVATKIKALATLFDTQ